MNVEADLFEVEAEEVDIDGFAAEFAADLRMLDAVGDRLPFLGIRKATEDTENTENGNQNANSSETYSRTQTHTL
jgi:hypothetical protein